MSKKSITTDTYCLMAEKFCKGYGKYFENVVRFEADKFLSKVCTGGKTLDVGCGSGIQSLYFKQKGYDVVPIDLSPGMVACCKAKGLDATLMDVECMDFRENTFDGIWCHTSLIHLDYKEKIRGVLDQFMEILKINSPLFISLRQGEGERWESYHGILHSKRWFLYFQSGEFEQYISPRFKIECVRKTECKNKNFLNYHMFLG